MSKESGGPAFPQASPDMVIIGQSVSESQGMTLRDYFAAAALQGLIAHASGECPHKAPELAYVLADKMLEARK